MLERIRSAYGRRAEEYAELLGSVEQMAPQDRRRIEEWASTVVGPILDAGCGPGHWTAHLHALGHDAAGVDPTPEFLEIAQRMHPSVPYRQGSFADLGVAPGTRGGVLAWYSIIHLDPAQVPAALESMATALRPGGRLLLGFFDAVPGAPEGSINAFDHAVTPAQAWPLSLLATAVEEAGFEISGTEQRTDPGSRPHAVVDAVLSDTRSRRGDDDPPP